MARLLQPFGLTDRDPPWFNTAMTWEKPAIFDFLTQCSNGQAGGPATQDPATQETLKKILYGIQALSHPNGNYYRNPSPFCHIYRERNPGFNAAAPVTTLKFNLLVFAEKYKYNDKDKVIPFYNPYDLLGLFLSLLGPAKQGALQYNFFLPMTAVYVRWCSRIAGYGDGAPTPAGVGTWPFMYQCSWRPISDADPRVMYFLGASLGGDNFNKPGRGDNWRDVLRQRRFDVVVRSSDYSVFKLGDFLNYLDVIPGASNPPGNCAETYTMTHTLQSERRRNTTLHGLALRRDVPMRRGWPTTYVENHYRGKLTEPCLTCGHALGLAGCLEANFADGAGRPRARPRP